MAVADDVLFKEKKAEWKPGVPVPSGGLVWLKQRKNRHLRESHIHMSGIFREQNFKAP